VGAEQTSEETKEVGRRRWAMPSTRSCSESWGRGWT